MRYTIRISEPYEQDRVYEVDSLDEVKSFLKRRGIVTNAKLYHVSVYLTPEEIDVYELMKEG